MAGLQLTVDAWRTGCRAIVPANRTWFPLHKAETVIGRASPADIVLPASYVSRKEAKVVREEESYFLEDIFSRNATVFKGRPIRFSGRQLLQDGDEIRVGEYRFVFLDRNDAALGTAADFPK